MGMYRSVQKSLFARILIGVLTFQMSGVSASLLFAADDVVVEDEAFQARAKFEASLSESESHGWNFLSSNREEAALVDVVSDVFKNREIYAVSPQVDELGARMTIHLKIEDVTEQRLAFSLSVLDHNRSNVLSARKFSIETNSKPEETALKFERAFRSMADEVKMKKDQLASIGFGQSAYAALKSFGNYIVPSLSAQGYDNTADMLKYVAGGASTLGFILLVFSTTLEEREGKHRLTGMGWLMAASFVFAGVSYIASGFVRDFGNNQNANVPSSSGTNSAGTTAEPGRE